MIKMPFDFHMHSTVSDGTDTPKDLLEKVHSSGIKAFSLTDHDAISGSAWILQLMKTLSTLQFVIGVEFSCKDKEGLYHILGYNFDPNSASIQNLISTTHAMRMNKLRARLEQLEIEFGIILSDGEKAELLAKDNPGKPHIANILVRRGYGTSVSDAIHSFIDKTHYGSEYICPEAAINGIVKGGGIPILAHPVFGSGGEQITGSDLERRVCRLISYGLMGLEGFYSCFTRYHSEEVVSLAEKHKLLITAGSDYHGSNKSVKLGDHGLYSNERLPRGLCAFLEAVR